MPKKKFSTWTTVHIGQVTFEKSEIKPSGTEPDVKVRLALTLGHSPG
jgi:hypothetical protein